MEASILAAAFFARILPLPAGAAKIAAVRGRYRRAYFVHERQSRYRAMTTLYLTHPICLEHEAPPGHPERPDRLRALWRALEDRASPRSTDARPGRRSRGGLAGS